MEDRKQFTFYASFHEAAQALQSLEERAALYEAICDYALYGTDPKLSGTAAAMFGLIRPNLDSSRRKAENRLGKKQTDNKQKTNQHQIEKKREDESKEEKESKSKSESKKENEYYVLGGAGGDDTPPADKPPKTRAFVPPSVEEVRVYCLERGNGIDPQYFVDYYDARGWMIGKNKMKDWRAAVRTWERNNSSGFERKEEKSIGDDSAPYDPYAHVGLIV